MDSATGRFEWAVDTDHWSSERANLAAWNGSGFLQPTPPHRAVEDCELLSIDAASGDIEWRTTHETDTYEPYYDCLPLAWSDDLLVATQCDEESRTGAIRGLDPDTGTQQWQWTASERNFQPVALAISSEEEIVRATGEAMTVGIDATTGEEQWRQRDGGRDLLGVGEFVFMANGRYIEVIDATGGVTYETLEPNIDGVYGLDWADGTLYYATKSTRPKVGAYETDYELEPTTEPTESSARERTSETSCPSCGSELTGDEAFCPSCGEELTEETQCPSCGHELDGDEAFCPNCGQKLD